MTPSFVRTYPGAERFCEMSVQVQKNPEIERKILFCQGFVMMMLALSVLILWD